MIKAKLVAVSNKDNAQLVYTTDGTEPTASSKKAKSGVRFHFRKNFRSWKTSRGRRNPLICCRSRRSVESIRG